MHLQVEHLYSQTETRFPQQLILQVLLAWCNLQNIKGKIKLQEIHQSKRAVNMSKIGSGS